MTYSHTRKILGFAAAFAFVLTIGAGAVFAAGVQIENIPDMPVSNDFVVGPGKQEMTVAPGESKMIDLTVTNRMADEETFSIETEDIKGSDDLEEPVILLGNDRGPYSLKDYVSLPEKEITLQHGEQATIPVTVSVPANAEPGGLYGSVVVSAMPRGSAAGGTAVVSRIATLFFVTVPGGANESGALTSFKVGGDRSVFSGGPIDFQLLFKNEGNVHLNPYGEIDVTNMLGEQVARIIVDPWFALPGSERLREVAWDSGMAFGVYRATARINRGYGDILDEKTITIVALPGELLAIVIVILAIVVAAAKFAIRRK
ncbi:MAG TPA: DUF916 domain-containing protein [Candidatus Paceibacterota bacterium]|nr:DUF916 domain-containing protein [Candidatus Paceibacterota bacterium]